MEEFFTEWTPNDIKWLILMILVSSWVLWLGYRHYKEEKEKPWLTSPTRKFYDYTRYGVALILLLASGYGLIKRLYLAIF